MFDKEYEFRGKHAEFVLKLTNSIENDKKTNFFNTNIDLYMVAPVVGFLFNTTGTIDKTGGSTKIFTDAFLSRQSDLKYIYSLIMILDKEDEISLEERINKAFRYENDEQKRKDGDERFNSFLLGGIEVLYNHIIFESKNYDEALNKFFEFMKDTRNIFEAKKYEESALFEEVKIV